MKAKKDMKINSWR